MPPDPTTDRRLFDRAPVALWELDLTGLVPWLEDLRARGVDDLEAVFADRPEARDECARRVRLRTANRAAVELAHAADVDEMRGPLDELVGQESMDVFTRFAEAIYRGERRVEVESAARAIDGTPLDVQATMWLPDDPAEWDSVLVGFVDITRRKRTERLLGEIAQGVSHVTGEPFLRSMVASFVHVLGADHALVGELERGEDGDPDRIRTLAFFSDDERRDDFVYPLPGTPCADVVSGGLCVFPSGVRTLFPDDRILGGLAVEGYGGMPLRDSEGKTLGVLGVLFSDPIAEPELVESALTIFAARAAAELERLRGEAERLALQRRLSHAQKMESVGRIAGGIAHDVNNLLAPILGLAELAQERASLDGELADDLGRIGEAARKGRSLTRQLLAFGSRQVLDLQSLEVDAIVEEMSDMLRRVILEDVEVRTELAAPEARVCADRSQLEQLLLNLAVNARDAMPAGGVLRIATGMREIGSGAKDLDPGAYVVVSVADTGAGMPPEVMANIFEPFFTTKGVDEGTGLGLSTVYGIATQHGGSVRVESEEGAGSTFEVFLPLEDSGSGVEPARPPGRASTGSGRILVVEDDDAVRSLTERMLRRLGYEPIPLGGPPAALELTPAELQDLDLLVTDVIMPGMSGVRLHDRLRDRGLACPVLYMTGYAPEIAAERGPRGEPVDVLAKPFTLAELAERVAEAVRPVPAES